MKVELGVSPINWSNEDDPSLGAEIPLEQCLAEIQEAGYKGVEMGGKFPRVSKDLAPLLDHYQLRLVSGWYSGFLLQKTVEEEWKAMQSHFRLLSDMGASVMVFAECTDSIQSNKGIPISHRPKIQASSEQGSEWWKKFGDKMTALAHKMKENGIRMVYHYHMGTYVEDQEDLTALMEHTGEELFLVLDTGHLHFAGIDLNFLFENYGHRIGHVHLKDVRPEILQRVRNEDNSFIQSIVRGVFTVPGDGCVDYDLVLSRLAKLGYTGWLLVEAEQDPVVANPLEYSKKAKNYLEPKIQEFFHN